VPEYIEADKALVAQAWYPRYLRAARPGKVVRVRRSASSYIVLFPRGASPSPTPSPSPSPSNSTLR
jgi:hypothetical protein